MSHPVLLHPVYCLLESLMRDSVLDVMPECLLRDFALFGYFNPDVLKV